MSDRMFGHMISRRSRYVHKQRVNAMTFNDLELQAIKSTVGALCRRMASKKFKDELRITYDIEENSVLLFEERRGRATQNNSTEWIRIECARFRYIRSRGHWILDWIHRGKWELYDPDTQRQDLRTLVKFVEEDENGAFFG